MRIACVQEENDENLYRKVLKIAKSQLGMKKLKEDNIQEVYRAGKKKNKQTRDIVIQFKDKSLRDSFLEQRKKIRRTTDPKDRIYINEDLTEYRQKLLFDARQVAKHNRIKGAWSQHGNIMILRNEGKPVAIKDYKELRAATGKEDYGAASTDDQISDQYTLSSYDDYGSL